MFDVNDFDETLPGPGSGTSSGWRRASSSPEGTRASPRRTAPPPRGRSGRPTGRRCAPGRVGQPRRVVLAGRHRGDHRRPLRPGRQGDQQGEGQARRADGGQGVVDRREVAHQGLAPGPGQADRGGGRTAPDHQRSPAGRPARRAVGRATARRRVRIAPWVGAQLPPHPADRPPPPPRGLRARRRGSQGRGRRQCRDPGLDPPAPGSRRGRPAVPPGQGGRSLGPRGVRGQEQVLQSRRARRHRAAPDAGGQRHLLGLAARRGHSTASRGTSTCASSATGRARSRSRAPCPRASPSTRGSAPRRWPGPMPARATASPSRRTSGTAAPSTMRSSSSPRPTPTRTSGTTTSCRRRSPTDGSRPNPGYNCTPCPPPTSC